jgi:hypothetical protein
MLLDANLSKANARAYLKSLLDSQLLVSDIEINITGPDYLGLLIARIGRLSGGKILAGKLSQIQKALASKSTLKDLRQQLDNLLGGQTNGPSYSD